MADGIPHVVAPAAVEQVVCRVIRAIAVAVADLLAFRAWAEEGQGNELVDVELVSSPQEDCQIAVRLRGGMHELALWVPAVAAYLAELAYMVGIMPGNREPADGGKVVHVSLPARFTAPGAATTAAGLDYAQFN
jgi:hypothetical protein